jgi:phosphatidate cytidylyltransferase
LKTFGIRSISGILYAAIVFGSILAGPWYFTVFLFIVQLVGLFELERLIKKNGIQLFQPFYYGLAIVSFLGGTVFILSESQTFIVTPLLSLIFFVFLAYVLFRPKQPFRKTGINLFGLVYLTLPLLLLMLLFYVDADGPNAIFLLSLFVFIWVNDTFAYMVGSLFGKHPLVGPLSPKKTWEGALGGLFFSLLGAYLISMYVDVLSLGQWLGFALLVVFFGTLGDLFESLLKRSADVKESGQLIPGHGGILDRIDSILMAAPFVYVFLYFMLR